MMKILSMIFLAVISHLAYSGDVSFVMDRARLVDLVPVIYGELDKKNFFITSEALAKESQISVSFKAQKKNKVINSFEEILASSGFSVHRRDDLVVIGVTESPAEEIFIYKVKYRSASFLSDVVQSVTGAKSIFTRAIKNPVNQSSSSAAATPTKTSTPAKSGAGATATESATSATAQIDKSEVDEIAFLVPPKDIKKISSLLDQIDTPRGEVLLRAAVYEVGFNKQDGSALNLAFNVGKFAYALGGGIAAAGGSTIKFSSTNFQGFLAALDADSRFKSLSKPYCRVGNGFECKFNVGSSNPVLGAAAAGQTGAAVQSVDYKDAGIILTVKPEIREATIDLQVNQELSNFVQTVNGVNGSPTLQKRAVASHMTIQPGEVVILAGLQTQQDATQRDSLPFLGWLLGKSHNESQSEILVFIEAQKI